MIDDHSENVKRKGGYQDYQESAGRIPVSQYPWGTLVGNALGIAGAHTAGYFAGGALASALAKTRLGEGFGRMNPAVQRQVLQQATAAAASIGAASAGLASLAGQMRIAEEVSRIESERRRMVEQGNVKAASVLDSYNLALLEMYG